MAEIFHQNIEETTLENNLYRKVLYTGKYMQFVLMSVKDDIHLETHNKVDQFIRIEQGIGKAIIDNKEYNLKDGIGIIIPAGSAHKIINLGETPLKLYSIYAPPEHPSNRIDIVNPDKIEGKEDKEYKEDKEVKILVEKLYSKYMKYKNKYLQLKKIINKIYNE